MLHLKKNVLSLNLHFAASLKLLTSNRQHIKDKAMYTALGVWFGGKSGALSVENKEYGKCI